MKFFFYLLCMSLLLASCYDEGDNFDNSTEIVITEAPKTTGETDLNGQVLDTNGEVISSYQLAVGDATYTAISDFFFLKGVRYVQAGQLIEVIKDDEVIGVANPYLLSNDMNKLVIHSFERTIEQDLQLGQTQTLDLGFELLLDLNNDQLTGDANKLKSHIVSAAFVSESFGNAAYDQKGQLLALKPQKGFSLDFYNDSQEVALKVNESMKLTMAEMAGYGLFRYDFELEYWVWVGDLSTDALAVPKTGYFMIADYEPGIYKEGLAETDMQTVSFVLGQSEYAQNDFYTTERGRWASVVPVNTQNTVDFYNACKELLVSANHSSDLAQPTVINIPSSNNLMKLETSIIECESNDVVKAGILLSGTNNEALHLFSQSNIETWVSTCDNDVAVTAFDFDANQFGPSIQWSSDTNDELQYLTACSEYADGFSFIVINDESEIFEPFELMTIGEKTVLQDAEGKLRITFSGGSAQKYEVADVNVYINDGDFGANGYYMDCEESTIGCGMTDFHVTHFDEDGWLRVSFSGTLWMQTISNPLAGNYPIEGVVMIKI